MSKHLANRCFFYARKYKGESTKAIICSLALVLASPRQFQRWGLCSFFVHARPHARPCETARLAYHLANALRSARCPANFSGGALPSLNPKGSAPPKGKGREISGFPKRKVSFFGCRAGLLSSVQAVWFCPRLGVRSARPPFLSAKRGSAKISPFCPALARPLLRVVAGSLSACLKSVASLRKSPPRGLRPLPPPVPGGGKARNFLKSRGVRRSKVFCSGSA